MIFSQIKLKEMNKITAAFIILFISLTGTCIAQPRLTLHAYGGYSIPLPNMKGEIPQGVNYNDYGLKYGYNFGIDAKYAIEKSAKVKITASVNYNIFRNNDILPQYDNANESRKLNILTAGFGAEYSFLPKNNVNPFLGVEFTGNFFNGIVTDQIGDTTHTEYNLKAESRYGFQINAGVDVISSKRIGVIAGVRYNFANLFGKDSASVSQGEFALWDKEFSSNGTTIAAKKIQYLQLYAGVSFYLMQPKKKVKK